MSTAVALGGNLGGPAAVVERFADVTAHLQERFGPAEISSWYLSDPVGPVQDQPAFVNGVMVWVHNIDPERVMAELEALEASHGRVREMAQGPRTLDLDLLWAGQEHRDGPLWVPHPRLAERAFVLVPLCELFGGGYRPPYQDAPIGTLLRGLRGQGIRLYSPAPEKFAEGSIDV